MEHTFHVKGMTCGHCEQSVKKAVLRLDAHSQVQIDRSHDTVVVQTEQPSDAVAHVITEEGYAVA
jgi:copper chaperone